MDRVIFFLCYYRTRYPSLCNLCFVFWFRASPSSSPCFYYGLTVGKVHLRKCERRGGKEQGTIHSDRKIKAKSVARSLGRGEMIYSQQQTHQDSHIISKVILCHHWMQHRQEQEDLGQNCFHCRVGNGGKKERAISVVTVCLSNRHLDFGCWRPSSEQTMRSTPVYYLPGIRVPARPRLRHSLLYPSHSIFEANLPASWAWLSRMKTRIQA